MTDMTVAITFGIGLGDSTIDGLYEAIYSSSGALPCLPFVARTGVI